MCAVMGVSFSSFLPSKRRPVPPSKMRIALPARTSTQLVLPPISTVLGPGAGMLPRTPQNVICILVRSSSSVFERTSGPGRKVFLSPVKSLPDQAKVAAVVVLGCSFRIDREGRLAPGALARRVAAGAAFFASRGAPGAIVVASGGRAWHGQVEADAIALELARLGVPGESIV